MLVPLGVAVGVGLGVGAYFLFKDTLNRIQYVERLRLYWITKDNAAPGTRRITKAFMRQTSPPWHRGSGIQVRLGKYTFQVGVLQITDQVFDDDFDGLLYQLDGHELAVPAEDIREEWVNAGQKEEAHADD
jgi:hypothetical protein